MSTRRGSVLGRTLLLTVASLLITSCSTQAMSRTTSSSSSPVREGRTRIPNSELKGVSCVSATWCVAVGTSSSIGDPRIMALVTLWNGRLWTTMRVRRVNPVLDDLRAVSCTDRDWCVAVGVGPLIEIWNGIRWQAASTQPSDVGGGLSSVYCYSRRACVAVGWAGGNSEERPLIESYKGTGWSRMTLAWTGSGSSLNGVSCVSATFCVAVGQTGVVVGAGTAHSHTLVLSRASRGWQRVTSRSPGAQSTLETVACTGGDRCVAAGSTSTSVSALSSSRSLIELYSGLTGRVAEDITSGWYQEDPSGISCWLRGGCLVVGMATAESGANGSFAERVDGARVYSLSLDRRVDDEFHGVSCVSNNWCMVVGSHQERTGSVTLAESWQGGNV
jgi:hypothetical protein